MQIYATLPMPRVAAIMLDDSRIAVGCREVSHILSGAMNLRGIVGPPFKLNHEAMKSKWIDWAAESSDNYWWALEYWECLCGEYWIRIGHRTNHRYETEKHYTTFTRAYDEMPEEKPTEFINNTGYELVDGCIHNTYCQLLIDHWDSDILSPTWSGHKCEKPVRDWQVWTNYKLSAPFNGPTTRRP